MAGRVVASCETLTSPPSTRARAEDEVSADATAGVVSGLVNASAFRGERTLAVARAIFCVVVLVRSLLVTTPTFARLATGIPPFIVALGFSLYVLRRREKLRPSGGFFVLSVAVDAAACFTVLLPMALWPELSRVPLLDKADISVLLVVVAASAFRHSIRASLVSWVLNTASFSVLMYCDRAAAWTSVERNVALLYLFYLAGAGSIAALVARRTRNLVTSSANAAVEVERARRNLALVLREHHDLRSQLASATLNAGLAYRELAQAPGSGVSGLETFIDRLQESLAQVNGAVATIKERSYAELARLAAAEPADLLSAASAVREQLRRRYPEAQLELRLSEHATAPLVAGGIDALRRMLLNLATNACEGSGARGASTITIESCCTPAGEVAIVVRDDGPGFSDVPLEVAGKLRLTSKPEGFGLGLMLVREIAEISGGRVACANDERGGARVELILPAGPARSRPSELLRSPTRVT